MTERDLPNIIALMHQIAALANCVHHGFFENRDWTPENGKELLSFDCLRSAKEDYKTALVVIADLAAAAADLLD